MRTDIIFRVASQRKPITAAAVLMLFEEGKLYLTDPVSKFIPRFKGQSVAIANPGRLGFAVDCVERENCKCHSS